MRQIKTSELEEKNKCSDLQCSLPRPRFAHPDQIDTTKGESDRILSHLKESITYSAHIRPAEKTPLTLLSNLRFSDPVDCLTS